MRIKNALRNSFFSVAGQIIIIFVGFFSQRVLNLRLGEELVGLNSVISNILALISVTELGLSVAVIYHLYRAVAEKQEEEIAALMNLYRNAYCIFAGIITVLGLAVMPFLPLFLKVETFSPGFVRVVYLLWLLKTVLSYLLTYRRSLLVVDQKEYVVSICTLGANAMNYIFIIIMVHFFGNYLLAFFLGILTESLINIWIWWYVGKKYPYLNTYRKVPLPSELVAKIKKDIKNIFVTKLSGKLLISTDSLIMSGFINLGIVGLYSNYTMITLSLNNIVEAFSNTLQPTVGNLFIEENHKKEFNVLRQITFVFFLFASFAATSLFALMTPFVSDIWLAPEYGLDMIIICWCVNNFYFLTMGYPLSMMMGVTGLFHKERNLAIAVSLTNIGLSLLLVKPFGIPGVLCGTFCAYLIQLIYRIYTLVHVYMKENVRRYVLDVVEYFVITLAEIVIVYFIKNMIYDSGNVITFVLLMGVCLAVPNTINLLLFARGWRMKSLFERLRRLLGKNDGK